jgi:hypothetical protein
MLKKVTFTLELPERIRQNDSKSNRHHGGKVSRLEVTKIMPTLFDRRIVSHENR